MTVDLLSVRLKEAKKELTNLKTAHLRGLGLLQVYKKICTLSSFSIEDDYSGRVRISIYSSNTFPPYPLLNIIPQVKGSTAFTISLLVDSTNYANNGYTLLIDGRVTRWDSYGLTEFEIISTAPIDNISLEKL